MKGLIIVAVALMVGSGCASKEQRMNERVEAASAWCQRLGIATDSPRHQDCVSQRYQYVIQYNQQQGRLIGKAFSDYGKNRRARQCANNPMC